jgi:O-methyltransferase domain
MPTWLSVYPVEEETKSWSPERPVFVDVGGGLGHQCAALKGTYPELPGRVILQDLPHAIQVAMTTPGVEDTVHDFFQPQPVEGMISAAACFAFYRPQTD